MIFGVEGLAPPSTAGVVTQGAGDIQMYAKGSILLGQSRVMTTFGGHIMGWSAEGDINSGRGAKSTVVYTPQRRLYDAVGNVSLSPTVPSTGAGISTLDPIPEVPKGDVDLVAPLGTVDRARPASACRATSTSPRCTWSMPPTSRSRANQGHPGDGDGEHRRADLGQLGRVVGHAKRSGDDAATAGIRAQNLPSIISVQILGYGNEPASGSSGEGAAPAGQPPRDGSASGYDPRSVFQMLGNGDIPEAQRARLTDAERRRLSGG